MNTSKDESLIKAKVAIISNHFLSYYDHENPISTKRNKMESTTNHQELSEEAKQSSELEEEFEEKFFLTSSDNLPYSITDINIEKVRYSLFEIKRKIEIRKEIILDPDFQRKGVWNSKQKSELIESILLGIPIPIIYLFQTKDSLIHVIDGRQRLSCIVDFMKDKFKLSELNIIKVINSKKFSELDLVDQRRIEDYQFDIYLIKPPTPERVKVDIFDRVNRGGTKLNPQEIRNALYQGKATKLLNDLSKLEDFKIATDHAISDQRMKDTYIILRFIAFYLLHTKQIEYIYKGDPNDFLAKAMEFLNKDASDSLLDHLKDIFKKTMHFIAQNFDGNMFRFASQDKKRPISMMLFECLSYLCLQCLNQNVKITQTDIIQIKQQFAKTNLFTSGDSAKKMFDRFEIINNHFKRLANDHSN